MFGISVLPFRLVYYVSAIFYMIAFFPIRIVKFLRLCVLRRIDVCHINLSTGASTFRKITFASICRIFGISYIIHLHGGKYQEFFAHASAPYRRVIMSFFQHAARVIVLGDKWKRFVISRIGVAEPKVIILPNAVTGPVDFAAMKKVEPIQILFLGRLFEPKGINELIDALSDPRLKRLSWTAVLAGDGEVARYRKKIQDLGLSERIAVPGWVDSACVEDFLTRSTIFALPSYTENLPLGMLEAMAFALCPVVTPVGSIEDVIENGRNGIVVPVRDAGALSDALTALITDQSLRKRIAGNARADFLRAYDIDNYQSRLEKIYREALAVAT